MFFLMSEIFLKCPLLERALKSYCTGSLHKLTGRFPAEVPGPYDPTTLPLGEIISKEISVQKSPGKYQSTIPSPAGTSIVAVPSLDSAVQS
jgi:hypothetical protein